MRKLLITAPENKEYKQKVEKLLNGWDVVYLDKNASDEEIAKEITEAEVVFGQPDISLLNKAEKLKWQQMQWAGVDRYSTKEGYPENVVLTCVTGAYGNTIAEHAIGMMLGLCRHFPKYYRQQTAKVWKDAGAEKYISGSTALILGVGDIGSECAKRLKGLGLKTIGICSRVREIEYFDEVYTLKELEEVLPKADVVFGCLPHTPETAGVLNYHTMSLMKDDSIIINVGRGSLIVLNDLIKLLDEGKFFGVGLDVMEEEPLNPGSSLWDKDNVIITPHVAGVAFGHGKNPEEGVWNIFIENIKRYLDNKELINIVDLKAGYAKKNI